MLIFTIIPRYPQLFTSNGILVTWFTAKAENALYGGPDGKILKLADFGLAVPRRLWHSDAQRLQPRCPPVAG